MFVFFSFLMGYGERDPGRFSVVDLDLINSVPEEDRSDSDALEIPTGLDPSFPERKSFYFGF